MGVEGTNKTEKYVVEGKRIDEVMKERNIWMAKS